MMKLQSIIQKAVLTVAFSLAAMSGYGQNEENGDNMYLYTNSADEATVYTMEEITKITFTKDGIQIWNTNWPTEYAYSNVRVIKLTSRGTSIPGDANGDGEINVADIVEIINGTKGKPSTRFNAGNADANSDGVVNSADIDAVRGHIMTK